VWYTASIRARLVSRPENRQEPPHPARKKFRPHGVIVGPDGAPWVTDSGLNAIVRVDPKTDKVEAFPFPPGAPTSTSTPPPSIKPVSSGSPARLVTTAASIPNRKD